MVNQSGLLTKTLTILLAVGLAGTFIYYRNGELQSKVSKEDFIQPQSPQAGTDTGSAASPGKSEQATITNPMLISGTKSMAIIPDLELENLKSSATAYNGTNPDSSITSENTNFYMMSSKSGAVFSPAPTKAKP